MFIVNTLDTVLLLECTLWWSIGSDSSLKTLSLCSTMCRFWSSDRGLDGAYLGGVKHSRHDWLYSNGLCLCYYSRRKPAHEPSETPWRTPILDLKIFQASSTLSTPKRHIHRSHGSHGQDHIHRRFRCRLRRHLASGDLGCHRLVLLPLAPAPRLPTLKRQPRPGGD